MILLALLLQIPGRTYWPATVAQLASGTFKHTHVAVTGIVAYSRVEDDADIHIRLVADTGSVFVIAEIIPALPLPRPPNGKRITVYGIQRFDPEHSWREIHPTEKWVLAP